jgi:hypothetical protein
MHDENYVPNKGSSKQIQYIKKEVFTPRHCFKDKKYLALFKPSILYQHIIFKNT